MPAPVKAFKQGTRLAEFSLLLEAAEAKAHHLPCTGQATFLLAGVVGPEPLGGMLFTTAVGQQYQLRLLPTTGCRPSACLPVSRDQPSL